MPSVTHFLPAQWGVYQKNSIGAVLWVAVVVAQLRPQWVGLGKGEARICELLCIGGLLASQSRQAAISLILAVAVATLLNPEVRRQSKLMLLGCVPLIVALYYSFSLAARNNPKFNSVSIRIGQFSDAIHVWHQSPVLGEGMRFFSLPQYVAVTAPPNVLIDNLASTGIVGSLAFFYLVFMTMRTMARLPRAAGTLGLVVLLGHYVDGLFDIFWIGASMIPPFMIAGMSLGMADAESRDGPLPASGPGGPGRGGTRIGHGRGPAAPSSHAAGSARTVLAAPFRAVLGASPAPEPRWPRPDPASCSTPCPLEARGGGVSTYIRELLAATPLRGRRRAGGRRPSRGRGPSSRPGSEPTWSRESRGVTRRR